jgi:hypothetical protein
VLSGKLLQPLGPAAMSHLIDPSEYQVHRAIDLWRRGYDTFEIACALFKDKCHEPVAAYIISEYQDERFARRGQECETSQSSIPSQ